MGNMTKAAAIFSILMGACLLATWVVLFALGQVPELSTGPFKTTLLLVAEALTGLSLIVGGYGLLTRRAWGLKLQLVALGMLLYCAIFSCGELGQGNPPLAIFFGAVATLAFVFCWSLVRRTL
jgi:peptidoglycan/LPS O-acetylase OafA/YrhL